MIKRTYFMSARCTESDGYCYMSITADKVSIFPDASKVFDSMSDHLSARLLDVRPNGNFEIVSFNRC